MLSLLVAIALQSVASSFGTPAQPIGPVTDWVTSDDYPPEALRSGQQGDVGVSLTIGAAGTPTACAVTTSSGSSVLDTQTCAVMMRRARFRPAADTHGMPIASTVSRHVNWVLPSGMPVPVEVGPVVLDKRTTIVNLAADGTVMRCTVNMVIRDQADPCADYPVGKLIQFAPRLSHEGHPVPAIVRVTETVTIEPAP